MFVKMKISIKNTHTFNNRREKKVVAVCLIANVCYCRMHTLVYYFMQLNLATIFDDVVLRAQKMRPT